MVQIYPKRFPSEIVTMRSAALFKILNKLNHNTYVINLSRDYGIGCTFNVNNLVDYKGFDCGPLIVSLLLNHSLRDPYLPHSQILIPLQQRS